MGDMADLFLEQVVQEECDRMSYIEGDMSTQEAFDRGFIDPLGQEVGLSTFAEENANTPWDLDNQQLKQEVIFNTQTGNRSAVSKKNSPNILKYKMMRGMADTAHFTKELSPKQKNWMSTNYTGGAEAFIEDMQNDSLYITMMEKCDKIIGGN